MDKGCRCDHVDAGSSPRDLFLDLGQLSVDRRDVMHKRQPAQVPKTASSGGQRVHREVLYEPWLVKRSLALILIKVRHVLDGQMMPFSAFVKPTRPVGNVRIYHRGLTRTT